ncbi:MAG: ABC transporter ATP-binding protein, partial [Ndongobacter sp.]|nr:ABC transporter ATP-binding protein [Ndongobacter sp.]
MDRNKRSAASLGKTVKRLLAYITGPYRLQLVFVVITILISALAGMAGSLFLRFLIDDFITPMLSSGSTDFAPLVRMTLLYGSLYYAGVLCTYVYNRLMVNIGQGVLKNIRDELFTHMQGLSIHYFDTHSHGELMSLYTNDTDTLRQMISMSIPQGLSSLCTIVTVFIVMVSLSIPLTLITLANVFAMLFVTRHIGGRAGRYFKAQQQDLGALNGYIEEMLSGQKVIKVFSHEQQVCEAFSQRNEALCTSATKANAFANIIMPIMGNLGHLHYVFTAILGGVLAVTGVLPMTLGTLATFLQLTRSFDMPFSQISQQLNSILMALAGAERIFTLIDEEPESDLGAITLSDVRKTADGALIESDGRTGLWAWKVPQEDGSFRFVPLRGDVRFDDLDFGYEPGKTILHNISLYAEPGQKVAFVGSTGAGKTTITNLINRFYDVPSGKIRYDGIDINQIRKSDLRRSLGIVLQDTHLFTGTIADNIRYGKLDATDGEVVAAARLAHADYFIQQLPNGYDTVISGDSSELSQGQCQLLAIARAAIADPPVLILDEATSSIDTRTESIVQQGMDALMYGRTVFVIAHRLSTIRNADVILVLEHGRIIERGTH